jgi:hypothetical protein
MHAAPHGHPAGPDRAVAPEPQDGPRTGLYGRRRAADGRMPPDGPTRRLAARYGPPARRNGCVPYRAARGAQDGPACGREWRPARAGRPQSASGPSACPGSASRPAARPRSARASGRPLVRRRPRRSPALARATARSRRARKRAHPRRTRIGPLRRPVEASRRRAGHDETGSILRRPRRARVPPATRRSTHWTVSGARAARRRSERVGSFAWHGLRVR